MINTEPRRSAPPWVAAAVIVVALLAIVLYAVHVLRPQAPNSDLKTPSSYPKQGAAPSAPVAH
ncbi:hypothetical protein CCAX7_16800 [Capsulimonas corticalis]|uniref:Uncharacterized protein n=1 Tax=Capsulimonas corticalis TaxID=2219043 RepID=A0A402CYW1_9BACT|nr:hypothetical protein [Capsulimonas corticalis]BDI29629.1 hypothetical protein CCAX7_16800 [Capsulimonas corticalis]